MIDNIQIKNLAIVRELSCQLEQGLNVFTGETGAGKSLIVDAISFLMGGRSQTDLVGQYGEELRVEASLSIEGERHRAKLRELGLDESCLYLIRTLSKDGRSKARINGKAVPISFLREALSSFVHLHGQQEHEALVSSAYQLDYLDHYAGQKALELKEKAESLLEERKHILEKIAELEESLRQKERQKDLLQYEINEIESARLKEDEDRILSEERNFYLARLQAKESLEKLQETLREEGPKKGFLNLLETQSRELSQLKTSSEKFNALASRLENILIELADFSWELNELLQGLDFTPGRLEEIEERLDAIARLKRKYGSSIAQIIRYLEGTKESLKALENIDLETEVLHAKKAQIEKELDFVLSALRPLRDSKAKELETRIVEGLKKLEIPHPVFRISFQKFPLDELKSSGLDRAEFLFSANPGEEERTLSKVASGGELSRLMLVMKSALASADRVSTLIFDEIDAGIGGRVGEAVAQKLKEISSSHQVLCITHLPQIAGAADAHYVIEKSSGKRSEVKIHKVEGEERVQEIARMLAGTKISPAVLAHARELMGGRTE